MLERARTPIEAKQVHDLAKAAEVYARLQRAGEEAVRHAQAIAVDALALMGEMLKAVEKSAGVLKVGPAVPAGNHGETQAKTQTLAEQGITKKQSMLAQSLATAKETQPTLFDAVKAGEVSVSAAHAEVKKAAAEPTIRATPDAPPARRPAHFRPGGGSDPDHPFAEVLGKMTALVKAINKAMLADDTGFLKANLSVLTRLSVKQRQVAHKSGLIEGGKVTPPAAKFVGLALLRSVVKNSGRLKKVMQPAQIKKLCEQINEAPESQVIASEGDE